jgi:multiple sugar transport system permease protein
VTRPAWATAIVFSFVASWNDATAPMIYIQSQVKKTLPLALSMLQGGPGQVARAGAFAAAALITTLPTIIVFTAMQSRVINTMTHSGIK